MHRFNFNTFEDWSKLPEELQLLSLQQKKPVELAQIILSPPNRLMRNLARIALFTLHDKDAYEHQARFINSWLRSRRVGESLSFIQDQNQKYQWLYILMSIVQNRSCPFEHKVRCLVFHNELSQTKLNRFPISSANYQITENQLLTNFFDVFSPLLRPENVQAHIQIILNMMNHPTTIRMTIPLLVRVAPYLNNQQKILAFGSLAGYRGTDSRRVFVDGLLAIKSTGLSNVDQKLLKNTILGFKAPLDSENYLDECNLVMSFLVSLLTESSKNELFKTFRSRDNLILSHARSHFSASDLWQRSFFNHETLEKNLEKLERIIGNKETYSSRKIVEFETLRFSILSLVKLTKQVDASNKNESQKAIERYRLEETTHLFYDFLSAALSPKPYKGNIVASRMIPDIFPILSQDQRDKLVRKLLAVTEPPANEITLPHTYVTLMALAKLSPSLSHDIRCKIISKVALKLQEDNPLRFKVELLNAYAWMTDVVVSELKNVQIKSHRDEDQSKQIENQLLIQKRELINVCYKAIGQTLSELTCVGMSMISSLAPHLTESDLNGWGSDDLIQLILNKFDTAATRAPLGQQQPVNGFMPQDIGDPTFHLTTDGFTGKILAALVALTKRFGSGQYRDQLTDVYLRVLKMTDRHRFTGRSSLFGPACDGLLQLNFILNDEIRKNKSHEKQELRQILINSRTRLHEGILGELEIFCRNNFVRQPLSRDVEIINLTNKITEIQSMLSKMFTDPDTDLKFIKKVDDLFLQAHPTLMTAELSFIKDSYRSLASVWKRLDVVMKNNDERILVEFSNYSPQNFSVQKEAMSKWMKSISTFQYIYIDDLSERTGWLKMLNNIIRHKNVHLSHALMCRFFIDKMIAPIENQKLIDENFKSDLVNSLPTTEFYSIVGPVLSQIEIDAIIDVSAVDLLDMAQISNTLEKIIAISPVMTDTQRDTCRELLLSLIVNGSDLGERIRKDLLSALKLIGITTSVQECLAGYLVEVIQSPISFKYMKSLSDSLTERYRKNVFEAISEINSESLSDENRNRLASMKAIFWDYSTPESNLNNVDYLFENKDHDVFGNWEALVFALQKLHLDKWHANSDQHNDARETLMDTAISVLVVKLYSHLLNQLDSVSDDNILRESALLKASFPLFNLSQKNVISLKLGITMNLALCSRQSKQLQHAILMSASIYSFMNHEQRMLNLDHIRSLFDSDLIESVPPLTFFILPDLARIVRQELSKLVSAEFAQTLLLKEQEGVIFGIVLKILEMKKIVMTRAASLTVVELIPLFEKFERNYTTIKPVIDALMESFEQSGTNLPAAENIISALASISRASIAIHEGSDLCGFFLKVISFKFKPESLYSKNIFESARMGLNSIFDDLSVEAKKGLVDSLIALMNDETSKHSQDVRAMRDRALASLLGSLISRCEDQKRVCNTILGLEASSGFHVPMLRRIAESQLTIIELCQTPAVQTPLLISQNKVTREQEQSNQSDQKQNKKVKLSD